MATILTKKSDTSSSVPLAADLTNAAGGAELAVNTADKRLYSKTSGGSVVELGTNPSALSLPNGTANGVPYLNGSKVLTSGSALTFDGSRFVLGSGVGLAVQGMAFPTSGAGLEAVYDGAEVVLQAYNRTTPGYLPIWLESSYTRFGISGSEAMRLTSTGLGIGTSSPLARADIVQATSDTANGLNLRGYTTGADGSRTFNINTISSDANNWANLNFKAQQFTFSIQGTEKMRLDSSGNLGLGVTPSAWSLSGLAALQVKNGSLYGYQNEFGAQANTYYNAGWKYITTAPASQYTQSAGAHAWYTAPSGTAGNAISFNQSMTLDASGNLLVGTTTNYVNGRMAMTNVGNGGLYVNQTSVGGWSYQSNALSLAGTFYHFQTIANGSAVGGITSTTTTTSFNTSSDYRLKENIAPMTGALAKVAALKPVTYKWKADGSDGEGFIAHELAEVCPAAVTGEKDAVDAEGKPKYQGIDVSFLVGTLTAAIQEQQAIIEGMKTRLAALESK